MRAISHANAPGTSARRFGAFTLVELMVSIALLSFLLLVLSGVTESARAAWTNGKRRVETFQNARAALEVMAREITPAVVDTRMQFVMAPGELLARAGALNVAEEAPALLWMAPLGENGELRCVGYYLYRDAERKFYRLKRIFTGPKDAAGKTSEFFPRMTNLSDPRDAALRVSPVHAKWFTRNWNAKAFDEEDPLNERAIVSGAADGVIAFWAQPLDLLGNPIPWLSEAAHHPKSELLYNSAAYFQVATSTPFESGKSFTYLAETPQSMKANRVPAAIEFTVITLDSELLARDSTVIPPQQNVLEHGALDVERSARETIDLLRAKRIHTARVFSTRAKLTNGS